MSGYTPVFADIYAGTLYGRWPAAAVWASLLPLFDRHGRLDLSYQAISGMTGWPLALLRQGIAQLMEPDEESRSKDSEGRRLIPLTEGQSWGWIAVNHAKYAEKARLKNKNALEVGSGKNRERMAEPPPTAGQRRSTPDTASTSTSTSASTTPEKNQEIDGSRARPRKRCPEDFQVTDNLRVWATAKAPDVDLERETERMRDYEFSHARMDWPAVWRTWMDRAQSGIDRSRGKSARRAAKTVEQLEAEANAKH